MLKIAFAGFRHPHIFSLYDLVSARRDAEISASCEEHPEESLLGRRPDIRVTHHDFRRMLAECGCDAVAIGDCYADRGRLCIAALRAGKHVLSDKPLCTSPEELDEIGTLAAKNGLCVGAMLDLRTTDSFVAARELIRAGELGEISQIQFNGQHPINRDTRPRWYFEKGKHGGTINDIVIHALDCIPFLTGRRITGFAAARCWRTAISPAEDFRDAGQCMMVMDNGGGILGDVSYAATDSFGFTMPQYWRFNIWGSRGMMEFNCTDSRVDCWFNGDREKRSFAAGRYTGRRYLDDFLDEISGKTVDFGTAWVLHCSRQALELQRMADPAS